MMGGRRRRAGQALVEFALVLVAVCSLFVAAFDIGRLINLYLVTVHAAREGARVASVAGTTSAAIQAAAQNAANDSIAPGALAVACQAVTFNAASGTYATGGSCPS